MSVLTRSGALPADALSELDDDAETSADAIVSYAEQLADLERVVAGGGGSAAYLRETFEDGLDSLDEGVEAYRDMVRSAATTVAAWKNSWCPKTPGQGFGQRVA